MNAIKSRTIKVGELHLTKDERQYSESLTGRAPKAFRVDRLTQRATAWVQNTLPGNVLDKDIGLFLALDREGVRSFKLVGAGSYQCAALYVTTESEGRERFRGTCQCCGGSQVVEHAGTTVAPEFQRMVLHGYTRPGDGQVFGRCSGTGEQPAEFDLTTTCSILLSLKAQLKAANNAMDKAESDLQAFHTVVRGNWTALELKTYREIEDRKDAARRSQYAAESYITFLNTHVVPKFGKPLTREVV